MNKRKADELDKQQYIIPSCTNIDLFPRDVLKYVLSFCRYSLIRFVCRKWRTIDWEIKTETRRKYRPFLMEMRNTTDCTYSEYCDKYCKCIYITLFSSVEVFLWYSKTIDSIWSRNWDRKYWKVYKEGSVPFCTLELEEDDKELQKGDNEEEIHSVYRRVCIHGSLDVIKYIYDNNIAGICFMAEPCIEGCIESNDIEKVKWAYSKTTRRLNYNCNCETTCCEIPVMFGNVVLVEYLIDIGLGEEGNRLPLFPDSTILVDSIIYEQLLVLQMILRRYGREMFNTESDGVSYVAIAIDNKCWKVVRWLVEVVKVDTFEKAMEYAIRTHIHVVKYLVAYKVPISSEDVMYAASRNDLEMLRYMKSIGVPIDATQIKHQLEGTDEVKYKVVIDWLNQWI